MVSSNDPRSTSFRMTPSFRDSALLGVGSPGRFAVFQELRRIFRAQDKNRGKTMRVLVAFMSFVLTLYGCGGGGGGGRGATYGPAAIVNTAGVDIRDTWKSTEPIASYFDLEEGGSLPRFEGLDASGYSVLGSKNGITYAQRTSGPTDTIDIDFTGDSEGYIDSLPDFVRGGIERAGKAWSHRLKDVLGPFMSTDGVVTRKGRDENGWPIPRLVDGILLDFETDYENPKWVNRDFGGSRGGIGTVRRWDRTFQSGRAGSRWRQKASPEAHCGSLISPLMRSATQSGIVRQAMRIRRRQLPVMWTMSGGCGPARR